jgi:hypothetical protein
MERNRTQFRGGLQYEASAFSRCSESIDLVIQDRELIGRERDSIDGWRQRQYSSPVKRVRVDVGCEKRNRVQAETAGRFRGFDKFSAIEALHGAAGSDLITAA